MYSRYEVLFFSFPPLLIFFMHLNVCNLNLDIENKAYNNLTRSYHSSQSVPEKGKRLTRNNMQQKIKKEGSWAPEDSLLWGVDLPSMIFRQQNEGTESLRCCEWRPSAHHGSLNKPGPSEGRSSQSYFILAPSLILSYILEIYIEI